MLAACQLRDQPGRPAGWPPGWSRTWRISRYHLASRTGTAWPAPYAACTVPCAALACLDTRLLGPQGARKSLERGGAARLIRTVAATSARAVCRPRIGPVFVPGRGRPADARPACTRRRPPARLSRGGLGAPAHTLPVEYRYIRITLLSFYTGRRRGDAADRNARGPTRSAGDPAPAMLLPLLLLLRPAASWLASHASRPALDVFVDPLHGDDDALLLVADPGGARAPGSVTRLGSSALSTPRRPACGSSSRITARD